MELQLSTHAQVLTLSTATLCTVLFKHHRPSAPTDLTHHQAMDVNVPIGCGDVVVGDKEGVIVIPANIADEVVAEAVEMTAFEDFVSEEVLKGRSIIGLYPPTEQQSKDDFLNWRQATGR
jgi:regulator of RNase E activity RraA